MLAKILQFTGLTQSDPASEEEQMRRSIIRHEARVGGTLFGPVPKGVYREFFCLDEYTWIWHEEWKEGSNWKSKTVRYLIRPSGIVKAQDGHGYRMVSAEEAQRLLEAVRNYQKRVETEVYQPLANAL